MKRKPGPTPRHYFQTSISLPVRLLDRVKALAKLQGVSHNHIYRKALEAYLNENPGTARHEERTEDLGDKK